MTERSRLLIRTAVTLALAAVLLVTIILPAEYGWDPTGSGEVLGLLALSDEASRALLEQKTPWRSDHRVFELAPFESVEFKYRLEADAAMIFAWQAAGEVRVEMHAEPDGAAPGHAETFNAGNRDHGYGTYTAPFPGIHGWFWENRSQATVTINLVSAGFYSAGTVMRDGFSETIDFATAQP